MGESFFLSPVLRICQTGCTWGPCDTAIETCNGYDDDCNTICDDGYACCLGSTEDLEFAHCTFTNRCAGGCVWQTDFRSFA